MPDINQTPELTQALAIDFAFNSTDSTVFSVGNFFENLLAGQGQEIPEAGKLYSAFCDFIPKTTEPVEPRVKRMSEILRAYAEIEPIVGEIARSDQESDPRFSKLGEGRYSEGFGFLGPNGEELVLRRPYVAGKASIVAEHVMVQSAIWQIPNTERMVAASLEDGVTISHLVKGQQLGVDKINIDDISPQHARDFAKRVIDISLCDVICDFKVTNFFHSKDNGFWVIDMKYGADDTMGTLRNMLQTFRAYFGKQIADELIGASVEYLPEEFSDRAYLLG